MRSAVMGLVVVIAGCSGGAPVEVVDGGSDAFVGIDATMRDAFATTDAYANDAVTLVDAGTDAAADAGSDAFVPSDAGTDAGCTASEQLCGGACVETTDVAHCGDCTTACTTSLVHAHATCASSTCGEACDAGFVLTSGACVLDVLDHYGMPQVIPLGDYRAFRGHMTSFEYDEYTFELAAPAHVQIDLMGNVQSALTAAQITSGDAITSSPSGYRNPSPANWAIDDLSGGGPNAYLCWSQDGFSCIHSDTQDIRYLRRNAASDGMWDGDVDMLPAGHYQIRVARGVNSGPGDYESFYYYGEIAITPD